MAGLCRHRSGYRGCQRNPAKCFRSLQLLAGGESPAALPVTYMTLFAAIAWFVRTCVDIWIFYSFDLAIAFHFIVVRDAFKLPEKLKCCSQNRTHARFAPQFMY